MTINIIACCDDSNCNETEQLSAVSDHAEVYSIGWVIIGDDEHYCPKHSAMVINGIYEGENE